jgi:hypothetical protein
LTTIAHFNHSCRMHFTTFSITALLASGLVSATNFNLNQFTKRQDAFIPETTPVESCENGWVSCGPIQCILPSRGDVCCSEGCTCSVNSLIQCILTNENIDGCPGESFCLTQGYCCPTGEDPATCAQNNSVTLSAGFNTFPVSLPSAPAGPATPAAPVSTTLETTTTSSIPGYTAPAYSTPVAGATGSANYSVPGQPSTSVQPFLGAANREHNVAITFLGALAGIAAFGML